MHAHAIAHDAEPYGTGACTPSGEVDAWLAGTPGRWHFVHRQALLQSVWHQ
jgi:hypothetical protein